MADIRVQKGDITKISVDAIVNPSNSHGLMGGGAALHIRNTGGKIIEDEAISKAPLPIGSAISTTAGFLPSKIVIHATTMTEPSQLITTENITLAMHAALELATELDVDSLAFPGMGCGVGGISYSDAAKTMMEEIFSYDPPYTVYLIGFTDELTREFERWLINLNQRTSSA